MFSEDDAKMIRESYLGLTEAMSAGDWGALGKHYTEDAVVMPEGLTEVHGRAAVMDWGRQFPKVLAVEPPLLVDIDGRDDLAYVRGSMKMRVQPEGYPEREVNYKFIEIRRRQPDGSWPIAIDIFNSNP